MRHYKNVSKRKMRQNLRKINKMETNNLPDKRFRTMVIKMLIKLGRRIDEHIEYVNKEIKCKREIIRVKEYTN